MIIVADKYTEEDPVVPLIATMTEFTDFIQSDIPRMLRAGVVYARYIASPQMQAMLSVDKENGEVNISGFIQPAA